MKGLRRDRPQSFHESLGWCFPYSILSTECLANDWQKFLSNLSYLLNQLIMKFAQRNYAYLHNEQQSLVFNLKYTTQMQLNIVQRLQANFVIELANTKKF